MVLVISGAKEIEVSSDLSVGEVRDSLYGLWNLAGDEAAEVSTNGGAYRSVDDGYVLRDGDTLSLSRTTGTKG